MKKDIEKVDIWAIFPAVGVYADKNEVQVHIQWLRTNLILTFKKKKNDTRKSN